MNRRRRSGARWLKRSEANASEAYGGVQKSHVEHL